MSEFSTIVFRSFKLTPPTSGRGVPASRNPELAQRVDGNTDSNSDGKINKKDRNGLIEAKELFEEVFGNRGKYSLVIEELQNAGLEDPLEITPAITEHVTTLFNRYSPKTQLQKALILFRSIIPANRSFEIRKQKYHGCLAKSCGFTTEEGGLEIVYNDDLMAPIRKSHGSLRPDEIIATPSRERIAFCLEQAHLLCCLLRKAGIKADIVGVPEHAYVETVLDEQRYLLDPAYFLFIKAQNGISTARTDRESIAIHYNSEGVALSVQGKLAEAIRCYDMALELKPNDTKAWGNKGVVLETQGKLAEAIRCYDTALKFDPNDGVARDNRRIAQQQLERERNHSGCVCTMTPTSNTKSLLNLLLQAFSF